MNKTIGIIGSRRRDSHEDFKAVSDAFESIYEDGDRIVSGGCPKGGDFFAERLALRHGISILVHYPAWNKYGKSAGFRRNTTIAKDADVLIACVSEDRKGGTEDTIRKFLEEKNVSNLILVEKVIS